MIEVPAGELAARIAEGFMGAQRPPGQTGEEALAQFPPETRTAFLAAAKAAMLFFAECASKGRRVQ